MSQISDLVASKLRDIPDFPKPGVLFKDFTPLIADGRGPRRARARHRAAVCRAGRRRRRHRGPRVHPRRCRWPTSWAWAWCRCARRASCRGRPSRSPTRSSTARPRSRCTPTPSSRGSGSSSSTTSSRPGAPPRPRALLVERAGAEVAAIEVVLELAFLEGRKRLADRPVNAILTLLIPDGRA